MRSFVALSFCLVMMFAIAQAHTDTDDVKELNDAVKLQDSEQLDELHRKDADEERADRRDGEQGRGKDDKPLKKPRQRDMKKGVKSKKKPKKERPDGKRKEAMNKPRQRNMKEGVKGKMNQKKESPDGRRKKAMNKPRQRTMEDGVKGKMNQKKERPDGRRKQQAMNKPRQRTMKKGDMGSKNLKERPEDMRKAAMIKKMKSSTKGGCPGRCIKEESSCTGGRVLRGGCRRGKCCVGREAALLKKVTKRKCKPEYDCTALDGECKPARRGCKKGQSSKDNYDGNYCSKDTCVCCYNYQGGGGSCTTKNRCMKKKGECKPKSEFCDGKSKMGKAWCSGYGCKCCLPPCKTKKKCSKHLKGTCMKIKDCLGQQYTAKKFCKGRGCTCCVMKDLPTTMTTTPSCSASRLFCDDCGVAPISVPDFRIVGGSNATVGEYPYQVVIKSFFRNFTATCGGSFIKKRWILTAAHCLFYNIYDIDGNLTSNETANAVEVFVGAIDLALVRQVAVVNFTIHENYTTNNMGDDIALIQLQDDLDYENDPSIQPICLAREEDIVIGSNAVVTGWGLLNYDGSIPPVLQEVALRLIPTSICAILTFQVVGFPVSAPEKVVCASTLYKDSCQGDSGSPMVVKLCDGRYAQIGIVSYGYQCAVPNNPGVYTSVPYYTQWIIDKTGSDTCQ